MLEQFATPVRRLVTFTLVAFLMFAGLLAPTSTQAQSQTIQSSLTGVTISYEPPYQLQEDGRYQDDVMETMMFLGSADILAMGFMSPLIDLNGARDIFLEELFGEIGAASTIDRGDYTGVSYSLDMLNIDGLEMGVFSLFMNQRSHGYSEFYIFIAPPAFFGSAMQTAQSSFTIDGNQLMDGVDAIAMGNMVTANIGITGGSAVDDVTDIADTSANTSGTSTTETTDTGSTQSDTGDTSDGDRLGYLLQVGAEYAAVDQSISKIIGSLSDMNDGVITSEEARQVLDEEYAFLQGTNDRVAQIEVPAGMQDFHQEALAWSEAISGAGDAWLAFVNGTGDSDQAAQALTSAIDIHITFGERLQEENVIVAGDSGSSESGDTGSTGSSDTGSSRTSQSTGTSETTTSSTDAAGYVEAVQNHRADFLVSLGNWNEAVSRMEGNPTDAEIQQIREDSIAEAEHWVTFSATAQQLTPPAGYEDAHAAYLDWAAEVTELGNMWIGAMNGNQADLDGFGDQIEVVADADSQLSTALESAGEGSTDTTATDTGTSSTGRSTRSTDSTSSGDSGETTSRTSRTSRTSDTTTENTSETSGSSSRSGRTSRGTESTTGNTSETSTAGTANEWVMEITGATITWSDDFSLNPNVEAPQVNDADRGEDKISLMTTTPDGVNVGLTVTVYANEGTDSTGLVSSLLAVPDAVGIIYGEGSEIVESEVTPEASALLVRTQDEIGPYYVYVQVTCVTANCDTVALLSLPSEGDSMLDALEVMETGVAIDGVSISNALPLNYIEDVVNEYGN